MVSIRGTKAISTIGYVISAIFFFFYGPLLWLACQISCNPSADSCTNIIGTSVLWVMLSVLGTWILPVSIVLDLIAFHRTKTLPELSRRIAWLNGSSLLGIFTCVILFSLLISSTIPTPGTCTIFAIQGAILFVFIIIPPLVNLYRNKH